MGCLLFLILLPFFIAFEFIWLVAQAVNWLIERLLAERPVQRQ